MDASVESPNGMMLHEQTKTKKGVFDFETSYGVYTFCFRFVIVLASGLCDMAV